MRGVTIRTVNSIIADANSVSACIKTEKGEKWVPARSLGNTEFLYRIKAAWLVFTGKADAVVYEQQ